MTAVPRPPRPSVRAARALAMLLSLVRPAALLAAPAPAPPAAAPAPAAKRPANVLLITFDTLRRDHVSCYGAERLTTPRIDALASGGVRFTDCQSVIPITGPSHCTILSGLLPQVHGAFRNGVPIRADKRLLPQMLAAQGYRTGAVVAGWTLKAAQSGLAHGFEVYDDDGMDQRYDVVNLMRRADAVTDAALKFVDAGLKPGAAGKPFFLFVHYFDAHEPYDSPLKAVPPANPAARRDLVQPPFTEQLPAYDREIAFADQQVGRLVDGLSQRGLLDGTLVLFTADHGQSFGDHGYGGPQGAHGRRLYQDCMAVPLIVSWPGHLPASVSDLPVSHLDILPTVAELCGASVAVPVDAAGASLVRVLGDPAAPAPWGRARRVRYGLTFRGAVGNKWNIFRWMQNKDVETAEPLSAYAVADGRKIVVELAKDPRPEVYDLVADPGERKPLTSEQAPGQDAWARSVLDWYARTQTNMSAPQPTGTDLENLRSLGYVE